MSGSIFQCDLCTFYIYDYETGFYICDVCMDEDDIQRLSYSKKENCPYFRSNDDYEIVRKQN